jgi:glycosyltransferase involved in cell wall biosynthesis
MSSAAPTSIVGSPDPGTPRILFVSHCAQPGGAELILCDLVRDFFPRSEIFLFDDGPVRLQMRAAGFDPTVGRRLDALLQIRRDGAVMLNLAFLHAISRGVMQVAGMARRHELVYANSQKAFIVAALATALVRRPLVWHLHDVMTTEHFGAKQLRFAIGLANLVARRVIVPSKAVADAFCAVGGRRGKLRVVPNGVSVPAGTRSLDRASLRAELSLPEGFLISVVGRIDPEKGQHVALEALALLPDAQCLIVGDAIFGTHDYKEQLHRLADSLGLHARVHFLGHRTDVPRLMRASDIVVQTSVRPESFARVIVEAMLCGTPVVAPREGGAPEILTRDLGALLYPPGDSGALANLLRSLQHDGERTARLVELGVERAERRFSVPRMQRDVNSVIREILGDRQ